MKTTPIPVPNNWQELQPHPLAQLTDFGAGIDLDALAEHMRNHGYDPDEAIVLHENKILDGRHRHAAAIKAGITPTFKLFVGVNAGAYACKKALRQHLDTSQRAIIAATLAKLPKGTNQHTEHPHCCGPSTTTREQAASMLNVSVRAVDQAKVVIEHGAPALQEAVKDGTISVCDAAKVASEPPEVQDQAVKAVRAGEAKTAAQAMQNGQPQHVGNDPPDHGDASEGELRQQVIFCRPCRVNGPKKGCPDCAAIRGQKPQKADRLKNGSQTFDWRLFNDPLGKLVRMIDVLGNAFGCKDTPACAGLRRKLEEFTREFKATYKQFSKQQPPEE